MGALDGKIAVVTGASRGIGRAIAAELAGAGADLALCARSAEGLAETAAGLEASGRRVSCIPMDVASAASVDAGMAAILEQFGRIDILVCNAGITRDTLLVRMSEAQWDEVVDTNLKGAFFLMKAVAKPMMKQRAGSIVVVSSVVGLMGNAGQSNYAASKAGLIGLVKSVARELASRGVRVNAVAPGFVETAMTAGFSEDMRKTLLAGIPLGRFGTPEDIARVALFLSGDDASYITGQVVNVSGGMWM
jgi:3-oxoacyl-[acyl-carrier protein] reductase